MADSPAADTVEYRAVWTLTPPVTDIVLMEPVFSDEVDDDVEQVRVTPEIDDKG